MEQQVKFLLYRSKLPLKKVTDHLVAFFRVYMDMMVEQTQ